MEIYSSRSSSAGAHPAPEQGGDVRLRCSPVPWAYWSCQAATLKAKPSCALFFPLVKPKTYSTSLPTGNTTPHAVSLTFSLPYAGNSRPAVMGSAQGAQDAAESGAVRTPGGGNACVAPPGHHRRSSHIWLAPRLPWLVKQNTV